MRYHSLNQSKLKFRHYGFAIVEILVALFIMSLLIFPIYRLLSTSMKVHKVSQKIFEAANFASSLIETIKSMKQTKITEINQIDDQKAKPPFDMKSLGLEVVTGKLKRYLTIVKLENEFAYNVYRITVDIENREKKINIYSLTTLLTVKK